VARLPDPGGDAGDWGKILNDFLSVEHNNDGSLKRGNEITDKEPLITAGSTNQYWRGDKTWQVISKSTVGLSNVDNTSDLDKPISTASQAAIDADTEKVRSFAVTIGPSGTNADYVCDGTADDVQIQAAITALAAAGGGAIYVRRGTYRISTTITFPLNANVIIRGAKWAKQGSGGTIFKTSASTTVTDMFQITGNANPTTNADLSHDDGFIDITFDGNSTTTNLVKLTNQDTIKIERCRFVGATNSIVTVWNSASDPVTATVPGGIFMRDCIISANSGVGIDLQYQTQCWISDCWFSGSSVSSWINVNASNKIHIVNCEFDTATNNFTLSDTATIATSDITAVACTFVSSSGTLWTDTRTNSSSDRVFISGTASAGLLPWPALVGSANTVELSGRHSPTMLQSVNVGDSPLIVRGVTGQTGRLLKVQNVSGTDLAFFNSSGNIFAANGSVTTPGISFTNDVGSGFYRVSSNVVGLAINGSQVAQFQSTGASNMRITPRVTTTTSSAAPTINTDNCDSIDVTALAVDITSMTTNLSGTPSNFQKLTFRIKDNGIARSITWGSSFESVGQALPTTTVPNKRTTVGLIYDSTTSKWGCVALATEA
jgi:hypothetical protein